MDVKKKYRKNAFVFGYAGNKRDEIDEIIKYVDKQYKTIVEPFCGSSAFSIFNFYENKSSEDVKYVLNDNNKQLIEVYKLLLPENNEKLKEVIETLNGFLVDLNKEKYEIIKKKEGIESYIFIHKVYALRAGLYPTNRKPVANFNYIYDTLIYKFMQQNHNNITLSCDDGASIIEKYRNDETALLFIDPPYILEYNKFYKDDSVNIYEYLYNNQISTYKCKVILCLNSNWIIKLLFDTHIKKTYGKLYQSSKKKTEHLIITN